MTKALIKVQAVAYALVDVGDRSEWDLRDGGLDPNLAIPKILEASATLYHWEIEDPDSKHDAPFKLNADGSVSWVGYAPTREASCTP